MKLTPENTTQHVRFNLIGMYFFIRLLANRFRRRGEFYVSTSAPHGGAPLSIRDVS